MSRTDTLPAGRSRSRGRNAATSDYLRDSQSPWTSLVFLLPMIVLYEIGTIAFARDVHTGAETRIIAFNLLNDFLALFGATGRYLPALAVVSVLLWWHIARRDPWTIHYRTLAGMYAESVCWAVPLLALAYLMARYLPLAAGTGAMPGFGPEGEPSLGVMIVLSLGAGIYEELVFRLAGFAVLSLILSDLLGVKPKPALLVTLLVTSVAFSLYHYLGWEHPQWQTFLFRTLAGFFFGVIFITRGFGVTAGCHAAYDVIVHCLRFGAI